MDQEVDDATVAVLTALEGDVVAHRSAQHRMTCLERIEPEDRR